MLIYFLSTIIRTAIHSSLLAKRSAIRSQTTPLGIGRGRKSWHFIAVARSWNKSEANNVCIVSCPMCCIKLYLDLLSFVYQDIFIQDNAISSTDLQCGPVMYVNIYKHI